MSEKPALNLTPESLGREIATAATNSRAFDQQLLERAAGIRREAPHLEMTPFCDGGWPSVTSATVRLRSGLAGGSGSRTSPLVPRGYPAPPTRALPRPSGPSSGRSPFGSHPLGSDGGLPHPNKFASDRRCSAHCICCFGLGSSLNSFCAWSAIWSSQACFRCLSGLGAMEFRSYFIPRLQERLG